MSRRDHDLDRELQFHRDQHAAHLHSQRQAALELGSADAAAEACRDVRPGHWLSDIARDLRYGLRLWRSQPGFATIVILTLALGIASTTIMVTLVEGVIERPLAFARPNQLVSVQEQTSAAPNATAIAEGWGNLWAVTKPNYDDLVRGSRTLSLGAWADDGGIVSSPGQPAYLDADRVTASLFPVLGVHPIAGRWFLPQEDRSGASLTAILSDNLATQRFGSPARALGQRIKFAADAATVVGVMPPGFDLTGYTTPDAADIYLPLNQEASPAWQNRGRHILGVAARLASGASLDQARQEAAVISHRLQRAYPDTWRTPSNRSFLIRPWRADVGDTATSLWLLLASAALVLIIACANVASLLLVRALAREPELAMRASLGASRARLARQCLTESLLFALTGGALGIVLAAAGLRPFLAYWPGGLPRAADVALDLRVLLLALAVSLLAGIAFSLAPIVRTRRTALASLTSRTSTAHGPRLQRVLVAAEVALAVALLAAAGVMGGTLVHLSSLNLGVNPQGVLTARVALPTSTLANTAQTRAAWNSLLTRVRALPGIASAATVDTVPLREGNNAVNYWIAPNHLPDNQQPTALATSVSSGYFQTFGIRLLAGRVIDERDQMGSQPVAVIDDVLARHAFGHRNPIGQQINIDTGGMLTIIGVVQHVRYWGPAGDDASPIRDQVYYAFTQLPDNLVRRWSELMSVAVRTTTAPSSVLPALRQAVNSSTGGAAVYEVRTLDQLARGSLDQQRFLMILFAAFAALAVLLAALGIYGVQAFLAARRLPELGVRVALGARRADIFFMVIRQSLALVAIGVLAGLVASLGVSRLLHHAVAGVASINLLMLLAVGILLLAVAAAASLAPALRASRADPLATLRQQ